MYPQISQILREFVRVTHEARIEPKVTHFVTHFVRLLYLNLLYQQFMRFLN